MSELPKIADAEWQVMKVIWAQAPVTASRVIETVTPETGWKPKTVKTLLNRLINKKAIGFTLDEKDNRTYHYYPLVTEEECALDETKSFLSRVYGGSMNLMLTRFLNEDKFSPAEIDELRNILDQKKARRQ